MDRLIIGRYDLLERIGEGGAATVFRARDVRLDRVVALKILREQFAGDPEFIGRFQTEAKLAASLNHPNVVDVYDYGEHAGTYFIAMEYVPGGNLKDRIRSDGPFAAAHAVDVARQILSALADAHARGLVHRDVKPQNVLIAADGSVKLTDFGIAQPTAAAGVTQPGTTLGTAAYIAPEQASGAPTGPPTDIYGAGLLLYEMLTGRPPFIGGTPAQAAYRHVNEQPAPPSSIVGGIPPPLEGIVLKALAKDPRDRYGSAREMLATLPFGGFPAGTDVTAPMNTVPIDTIRMPAVPSAAAAGAATPRGAVPRGRSNDALLIAAGLLGLLLLCGLAGLLGAQRLGLFGGGPPRTPLVFPSSTATRPAPTFPAALPWAPSSTPSPTRPPQLSPTPTAAPAQPTAASPAAPQPTVTTQPSMTPLPSATSQPSATPLQSATAVPSTATPRLAPPTPVPPPTAAPSPTNTTVPPPTAALPPINTTVPTSAATRAPVPTQPLRPSITATPAPPRVTTNGAQIEVLLEDNTFTGGWRNPGASVYKGRTAEWVYGLRTDYSTMTVSFDLPAPAPSDAILTIIAMDSEGTDRTAIQIELNGREIFRGPSPFADDDPGRVDGTWSEQAWRLRSGALLLAGNRLVIRNIEPDGAFGVPPWFMLDRAMITYRA